MAASELQRSDGSHEEVPNVIHARRSERLRPVHFKGEQELRIDETVTPLIADHTIGPMIVVGIDSAHGEGRDYEYIRGMEGSAHRWKSRRTGRETPPVILWK